MKWKLFKTKEEKEAIKQQKLQSELDKLIAQYKPFFNTYGFDGKVLVAYGELKIKNNKIVLTFKTAKTPDNLVQYETFSYLQMMYGDNFLVNHRVKFIELKDKFEKLGLEIKPKQ